MDAVLQHVPAPAFEGLLINQPLLDDPYPSPTSPTSSRGRHSSAPSVAIVGGSMGGCCTAIALASIGCPVTVFERTPGALPSQGAGLVIQPDMAAFLCHFDVCDAKDISFVSTGRQYVDRAGAVIDGNTAPQLFTAWDVLHRTLRRAVPDSSYRGGCSVTSLFADPETGVKLTLNGEESAHADLLVGADGVGSIVRSSFHPGSRSSYQGYVAWRGVVPEAQLPPHVLEFLSLKFTVHQGADHHILAYMIPGKGGEVGAGQRRLNWVWYRNVPGSDAGGGELERILTGTDGRRHGFSVPRGALNPEVAAETRAQARSLLPPQLADLVAATDDIFVQAIHDFLAPELVFNDRVALVGDAGCILRPHTAAGTTKAAVNAWALAKCLGTSSLRPALQRYNESMMSVANILVKVGVDIGTKSQFPKEDASPVRRWW